MLLIVTTFAANAQESPFGSYTYDGSGNIVSIGSASSKDSFLYDEFGRLKSAALRHGPTQTFTYDRYGNILTVTTTGDSVVKKPGVNSQTNRIDKTVDDNGQGNNVVGTYDARGNLITYPSGAFAYDGLEMMTEATVEGVRRFHIYSATDERVLTISTSGPTTTADWTLRDPNGRPLRRFTQSNGTFAWTEDYIYRDGQLLAAAVPGPDKIRHFHLDHLGTPRVVTGNGGTQIAQHHYHPFGATLPSSTNDGEKIKFTGHERDATTLDYMHARFYDPSLGRFLSVDPVLNIERAIRQPQNWNRYSYVMNNPLRYTDPDGREHVQEPGFTKSLSEAGGWADQPSVSWAFYAQGALLSLAADEFVIGPAVGRAFSAVGRFFGAVSNEIGLSRSIMTALRSTNAATRLEGEAAAALSKSVTGFQRVVKGVGEVDVETAKAIVEVTGGRSPGKLEQITKLIGNKALNPDGKPVVVYGPNLGKHAAQTLQKAGAIVVRTLDELKAVAQ